MAEKRKGPPENAPVMKAIAYIKSLQDDKTNPRSLADIANLLRNRGESGKVDKATVGRWLKYTEDDAIPPKTRVKIISAAEYLRRNIVTPTKLRICVIGHATEMLGAHLIAKYPEWQTDHGVSVDIMPKRTIREIINALESGEVDFAIAPKGFNAANKNGAVKRFFQISSIKASGLFPFEKQPDGPSFAHAVEESLTMEEKAVGLLPNADYEHVLGRLLSKYNVKMPPAEEVRSHDDALTKLKAGEIAAVVGHSVFIANLQKSLRQHPGGGLSEHAEALELLKRAEPVKLFDNVEMDVFINSNEIKAEVARRGYRLLYHSIHCMNYQRDHRLAENVNAVLGLNSEDAMSGLDVLKEFTYEISSIDPGVLNELWKG